MLVKEIIIETLKQIQRDRVTATPQVYAKTFCQVAKRAGLEIEECRPAKAYIDRLPTALKEQAINREITQMEDLASFLIGELRRQVSLPPRQADRVVRILVDLLAKAMTPSFAAFDTARLNEVIAAIEEGPDRVLDPKWQKQVVRLVAERIGFDRSRLSQEAGRMEAVIESLLGALSTLRSDTADRAEGIEAIHQSLIALDPEQFSQALFTDLKQKLTCLAKELSDHATGMEQTLSDQQREITDLHHEIAALNQKLKSLEKENAEDYLTRVQTKRIIDLRLKEAERDFENSGTVYGVCFLDIDHFKKINDTYGHEGGDRILQAMGELLNRLTPEGAMGGRYGGEEFVALLPQTSADNLLSYAETIRQEVASSIFRYQDHSIRLTLSAGVALRDEAPTMESTLREADARLYRAKNSGRNRVAGSEKVV